MPRPPKPSSPPDNFNVRFFGAVDDGKVLLQFCRIRTAGSLFALHNITDFGVHLTKGIAETEIPHAAEL